MYQCWYELWRLTALQVSQTADLQLIVSSEWWLTVRVEQCPGPHEASGQPQPMLVLQNLERS